MRESHRLKLLVWENEDRARAATDPVVEQKYREKAEQYRCQWVDAVMKEPRKGWALRTVEALLHICFAILIILSFAAMCADVILGLKK